MTINLYGYFRNGKKFRIKSVKEVNKKEEVLK